MGAAVRVITWQCAKRANRIGIIPLVPYRAFLGRDSARKFQHIGQLGQLELVNLGNLLNAIPGVDGLQYFSEGGQSSPKDPEPPVLARQDFYLAALGPIEPGCTLEPVGGLRPRGLARLAWGGTGCESFSSQAAKAASTAWRKVIPRLAARALMRRLSSSESCIWSRCFTVLGKSVSPFIIAKSDCLESVSYAKIPRKQLTRKELYVSNCKI